MLSIIWRSGFLDKIKRDFFQAVALSVLQYGCTIGTLMKCIEKILDANCTRILCCLEKNPGSNTPQSSCCTATYPPFQTTIQVRRTIHAVHCWRSKDKLINDVLFWTPIHRHTSVGRLAKIYIHQLCADTGCSLENLPEGTDDRRWRESERERFKGIHAISPTWWWWWWWYNCLKDC